MQLRGDPFSGQTEYEAQFWTVGASWAFLIFRFIYKSLTPSFKWKISNLFKEKGFHSYYSGKSFFPLKMMKYDKYDCLKPLKPLWRLSSLRPQCKAGFELFLV